MEPFSGTLIRLATKGPQTLFNQLQSFSGWFMVVSKRSKRMQAGRSCTIHVLNAFPKWNIASVNTVFMSTLPVVAFYYAQLLSAV